MAVRIGERVARELIIGAGWARYTSSMSCEGLRRHRDTDHGASCLSVLDGEDYT